MHFPVLLHASQAIFVVLTKGDKSSLHQSINHKKTKKNECKVFSCNEKESG